MPHDCKGKVVEVGQEVIVRFEVKTVYQGEDYCNVDLESVLGMPPTFEKTGLSAINTKQVEVVKEANWRTELDDERDRRKLMGIAKGLAESKAEVFEQALRKIAEGCRDSWEGKIAIAAIDDANARY